MLDIATQIQTLVARNALFVVNHSGGKDSQAMLALVRAQVPAEQIVVVHAELPEVDWEGVWEHVQACSFGLPTYRVVAASTFLGTVERRGMFPSKAQRWCTSDLKRTPIEVFVRRIAKERGQSLIVNCVGLRAEESADRAKAEIFKVNSRLSKAGREVYDWLPVHHLLLAEVLAVVANSGQELHFAYKAGMSRLSCCFCVMASKRDLTIAAGLRPALYSRLVEMERRLGHTMFTKSSLEQMTGIAA